MTRGFPLVLLVAFGLMLVVAVTAARGGPDPPPGTRGHATVIAGAYFCTPSACTLIPMRVLERALWRVKP